jgi:Cu/Ag efflux pump CusA
VIGGLTTATAMTLLVLPAIYGVLASWLERRRERRSPPAPATP